MFTIKTLNAISPVGLAKLNKNLFDVSVDADAPDGILVRSADLLNTTFNDNLLAIARAAVADPPVLILDEATSALDNESEILVGQSLEKLAHGRTTLTIAHRLTTIKDYDRILVLGEEGIVEEGTHAQLLEKQGVYYRLWNQLPAEDEE